MINVNTRQRIKGHLEGFIQGLIDGKLPSGFNPKALRISPPTSKEGRLKPFHESLLPEGLLAISEFERSFSTKLGTSFEECAKLIASEVHKSAHRGYVVSGQISTKAVEFIESQFDSVGSKGIQDGAFIMMANYVASIGSEGKLENREIISDLYIERIDKPDLFIELKSPKPNKGQCIEALRRQLLIHGITGGDVSQVRTFFASAYNPYGLKKSLYKHSFGCRYMDMLEGVLIGKEFWDLIGGPGTYEDVLTIYKEFGLEKGPDMLDQLALGY